MKKVFLTFADSPMQAASRRLARQASDLACYDEVLNLSEVDLDADFANRFSDRLVHGSRGFGYWCWKPQILLQVLTRLEDGDLLQYTDSGCHLNGNGMARLNDYFEIASRSSCGLLVFQAKPPTSPLYYDGRPLLDLREFKWTKADLLQHFSSLQDGEVLSSQQIGAGVIFVRKCVQSVAIIREWASIYEHDFSLVDDTPSLLENLTGFIEHRHDQSVFSLLCKKHGAETLSSYEYWFPLPGKLKPDWSVLRSFPIHAKRDRGLSAWAKLTSLCNRLWRRCSGGRARRFVPWLDQGSTNTGGVKE